MGSLFRSEEMALAQLFVQPEAAYYIISELGETGVVQFRDLNDNINAFQRKFVNEVRRCDDMERMLRYIEKEVQKDEVHIPELEELPKAPNPREIIDLEAHLEKIEGDIQELSDSAVNLKSNYLELLELRYVLEKTQIFFHEDDMVTSSTDNRGHLSFISGVINRERLPGFERMLWRISRGNIFVRQADISKPLEDPQTGDDVYKTVFAAFFQGEQLKSRIMKVCAGFRASVYPCPSTNAERTELKKNLRVRLEDLKLVLNQTQDHRERVLVGVAKELQSWIVMVKKMKAIYHTLNMFNMDVTTKCLIGECWLPVKDGRLVREALSKGANACGSSIPSFLNIISTAEEPPTFNQTNKFTQGFQNLIDAYGIATYRELNPSLYTLISFPFLFAVMFGDCGHGVILLLFGLWLVRLEKKYANKKIENEILDIFYGGRYIVVLMGIFSIYTGLIYNDIFSRSFNIFGSSWETKSYPTENMTCNHALTMDPKFQYTQKPYPFGLDPVWQLAENKIIFLNTYKMKLSIIFGVVHMIFGVCLGVVNYVHFHTYADIFLVFLPQILFLAVLFLWMCVMMFMKWSMYNALNDGAYGTYCAPSVLILFINMVMFGKEQVVPEVCEEFMFKGQHELQLALLIIAVLCIPVLLLGKPIHHLLKRRSSPKHAVRANGDLNQNGMMQHANSSKLEEDQEEEPLSEVFLDQAIHTIEYVLSTISHTASYLRLWALSLAHAQLSEVLWDMVLQQILTMPLGYVGAAALYLAFAFWAVCTIGILVMMEGLSAFLHTLRLHWVEFMSKFYRGEGYKFEPFCFKTILEGDDVEG